MDVLRQPPESFLAARRVLDELPAVLLLQDWDWNEHVDKWVLNCQINLNI
jgi:hypothetical protein